MNERDAEFVNWKIYGPIKLPVDDLSVTHAAFFFSKSAIQRRMHTTTIQACSTRKGPKYEHVCDPW